MFSAEHHIAHVGVEGEDSARTSFVQISVAKNEGENHRYLPKNPHTTTRLAPTEKKDDPRWKAPVYRSSAEIHMCKMAVDTQCTNKTLIVV